jgi:hypothetical protein
MSSRVFSVTGPDGLWGTGLAEGCPREGVGNPDPE